MKSYIAKHFLPFYALSIHFFNGSFDEQNFFDFYEAQLINTSFMVKSFVSCLKIPTSSLQKYSHILPSRSLIALTLYSGLWLISNYFCVWYEIQVPVIFFMGFSCSITMCWRDIPFSNDLLWYFCWRLIARICRFISELTILFH